MFHWSCLDHYARQLPPLGLWNSSKEDNISCLLTTYNAICIKATVYQCGLLYIKWPCRAKCTWVLAKVLCLFSLVKAPQNGMICERKYKILLSFGDFKYSFNTHLFGYAFAVKWIFAQCRLYQSALDWVLLDIVQASSCALIWGSYGQDNVLLLQMCFIGHV